MTTVTQTNEYNTHFPGLDETPMEEQRVTPSKGKKKQQRSQRQKMVPLAECGFVSRLDELKDTRRKPTHHSTPHNHRAWAYEKLQDKKGMAEKLVKSKMCWSVKQGVPCPHGKDKCNFAHAVSELRGVPCLFGRDCRFIRWDRPQQIYVNATTMPGYRCCHYTHPMPTGNQSEDRDNWLKRIDVVVPPPSTTSVLSLVPSQVTKAKTVSFQEVAVASPPLVDPDSDSESLLETKEPVRYSIPKELALETLKSAIEEGQTVITLELT